MDGLRGARIGLIERRRSAENPGSLSARLVPLLIECGARVELVHAEDAWHRLDAAPAWDVAVLKSGSAAALHLAAAAEAWAIPSVNASAATRLAQDKLATAAILQRAGLPVPGSRLVWLADGVERTPLAAGWLAELGERRTVVKAARGSRGVGLWTVEPGQLPALMTGLPPGPYVVMDWVPHRGEDLKVYAAGNWLATIARPFPAETLAEKEGRPVPLPEDVAGTTRAIKELLGLTCFGCDFVAGPDGWTLVDVNAFPGYKGVEAAEPIALEIARTLSDTGRPG